MNKHLLFGKLRHFAAAVAIVASAAVECIPVSAGENTPFVLAIDAGHGGRDLGTSGRRLHEKNVTLDVARKLRDIATERLGDSCDAAGNSDGCERNNTAACNGTGDTGTGR